MKLFILTKNQIITLLFVTVFFVGNDLFMGYLSDASTAEISRVGEKVAKIQKVGSGSVLADTEWGNKVVLPPKPENAPKPNFTIYESKILNHDSPLFSTSTEKITP